MRDACFDVWQEERFLPFLKPFRRGPLRLSTCLLNLIICLVLALGFLGRFLLLLLVNFLVVSFNLGVTDILECFESMFLLLLLNLLLFFLHVLWWIFLLLPSIIIIIIFFSLLLNMAFIILRRFLALLLVAFYYDILMSDLFFFCWLTFLVNNYLILFILLFSWLFMMNILLQLLINFTILL